MQLQRDVNYPRIEAESYEIAGAGESVSFLLFDRSRQIVGELVRPFPLSALMDEQRAFWRKLGMRPGNDALKKLIYVDGVGLVEVVRPLPPGGHPYFVNPIGFDPAQAGLH